MRGVRGVADGDRGMGIGDLGEGMLSGALGDFWGLGAGSGDAARMDWNGMEDRTKDIMLDLSWTMLGGRNGAVSGY